MVSMRGPSPAQPISLSVLALSSRFDGPMVTTKQGGQPLTFSTRSVESF